MKLLLDQFQQRLDGLAVHGGFRPRQSTDWSRVPFWWQVAFAETVGDDPSTLDAGPLTALVDRLAACVDPEQCVGLVLDWAGRHVEGGRRGYLCSFWYFARPDGLTVGDDMTPIIRGELARDFRNGWRAVPRLAAAR